MITSDYLFAFAAILITPILVLGAKSDMKTRMFPKSLWEQGFLGWVTKVSGLLTFLAYLLLIAEGLWTLAAMFAISAIVAVVIFALIGYRFGGGGDWRAMIYIALIAPGVLFTFTFWICLCLATIVVAFNMLLKPDPTTHPFKRHIPFSAAICAGYCVTLAFILVSGGAA
jgi:hypothetical protein